MALEISSTLLARLLSDAQNSPGAEICGLLFGTAARIDRAQACVNVAGDPGRHFEIDPVALFAAHRASRHGGPRLIGHYHSHPSGVALPSKQDRANAMGDGAVWLILTTTEARLWRTTISGDLSHVDLIKSDRA